MTQKQKLELTWIGKEKRPRLEPRVLVEVPERSHHASVRHGEHDIFDNMLIHGDNLLALKALEQDFAGKIKCIYIDPPYNTGNAFEHFDDGLEHSIWLGLMRERLELLRVLLRDDGFIFVQIDDNEMAYLKVLLDEVFGRDNYINTVVWRRKGGSVNPSNKLNNNTDFIFVYGKTQNSTLTPVYSLNDEETQQYIKKRFVHVDENGRRYRLSPIISPTYSASLVYEYKGYQSPPNGWSLSREKMEQFEREGRLMFPADKSRRIQRKQFLDEYKGRPIGNLWSDIFVINPMSSERTSFTGGQKPEALIQRVVELATKPGDWVLDSFLGSGTTAAVAHKMGRRWIGVELGDHCYTHCQIRLDKVVDGADRGGITDSVGWGGGGGYRFYELAPTLIKKDQWGQLVINPDYKAEQLAEAVCKLEGFRYAPSETEYFIHGQSTERDYIWVTTSYLSADHQRALGELVGPERSLLVCCKGFATGVKVANLTVKKIPQAVLDKCEWGHDDYSLNVENLPMAAKEPKAEQGTLFD
jgi:adenine-specific DNA-methyltransferase